MLVRKGRVHRAQENAVGLGNAVGPGQRLYIYFIAILLKWTSPRPMIVDKFVQAVEFFCPKIILANFRVP
jgi:hypothetical protein